MKKIYALPSVVSVRHFGVFVTAVAVISIWSGVSTALSLMRRHPPLKA